MEIQSLQTAKALSYKAADRAEAITGAVMAAMLGLVVVWGVGFSHMEVVHNAAHDTRHANAFPCH